MENPEIPDPPLNKILAFEFGVGLLGVALFWLIEGRLFFWVPSLQAVVQSLVFALPMLTIGVLLTVGPAQRWRPVSRIYELIAESFLGRLVVSASYANLAWIALAAGVGEELLFRGAIQFWFGLLPTAVFFGLLHALTPTYFIIATLVGMYLGWVFEYSQQNVFVPAMVHALYDFAVLCLYKKRLTPNI